MRHLALVGLMGSGKSTVGRRVAERLGRPFLDSDREVEKRCGRTVREIFEVDGEAEFRRREAEVMATALNADDPTVLAAAGGSVLDPETRRLLTERADTVFLDASVDRLVERIGRRARPSGHRPLIDDDPEEKLRLMHDARRPLYLAVARHRIDVDALHLDQVVDEILRTVETA